MPHWVRDCAQQTSSASPLFTYLASSHHVPSRPLFCPLLHQLSFSPSEPLKLPKEASCSTYRTTALSHSERCEAGGGAEMKWQKITQERLATVRAAKIFSQGDGAVNLPKTFIPSLNSRPFLITILVSSGASVTVSFNREMTELVVLASSSDGGVARTFFVTVWI